MLKASSLSSLSSSELFDWQLTFLTLIHGFIGMFAGGGDNKSGRKIVGLNSTWHAIQGNGWPLWGPSEGKAAKVVHFHGSTETRQFNYLFFSWFQPGKRDCFIFHCPTGFSYGTSFIRHWIQNFNLLFPAFVYFSQKLKIFHIITFSKTMKLLLQMSYGHTHI